MRANFSGLFSGETAWVAMSLMARVGANVLLFYGLAVFLSPDAFGEILLFFSVSTLLACFIDYGFSTYILSKSGSNKSGLFGFFRRIKSARIYLTAVIFIIYAVVLYVWPRPESGQWALSYISKCAIFLSCVVFINSQTAEVTLRALGQVKKELRVAMVGNFLYLLPTTLVVYFFSDPSLIPFAMLLGRLAHYINSARILNLAEKDFGCGEVVEVLAQRGVLNYLFAQRHYAVQTIAATAYLNIDTVIVGLLLDPKFVGLYQLYFRVVLGLGIIAEAHASTRLRCLVDEGIKNDFGVTSKSGRKPVFLAVFVAAVAAGLTMVLSFLIVNGYLLASESEKFYKNSDLLILSGIIPTIVFIRFWAAHLGAEMTARQLQNYRARGALLAFVVVSILCWILVPKFGLTGAVLSNLVGNLVLTIMYFRVISNERS